MLLFILFIYVPTVSSLLLFHSLLRVAMIVVIVATAVVTVVVLVATALVVVATLIVATLIEIPIIFQFNLVYSRVIVSKLDLLLLHYYYWYNTGSTIHVHTSLFIIL